MTTNAHRVEERTPTTVEGEVRPAPVANTPPSKTRAERFAEAHWLVVEQHSKTFEKLAK